MGRTILSKTRHCRVARIPWDQVERLEEFIEHIGGRVCETITSNLKQACSDKSGIESNTNQVGNPLARVSPPDDFIMDFINQFGETERAQSLDLAHNPVTDRPQAFDEIVDGVFASGRSSHTRSGCAGGVRRAERRCLRDGRGRHGQPQKGKREELHGEQLDDSRWLSSSTG